MIDENGFMNDLAPGYEGLSIEEERKKAEEDLRNSGFLEKTENMVHSVGHCYRCRTVCSPISPSSGS